jgi:hypothetical protein
MDIIIIITTTTTHINTDKMHTKFQLESLKGRNHSEDLGIDKRIILKWILGRQGWRVSIGFIWLRIVTGGGLL